MPEAAYPEFFNDVFGPVMQPGSSSHTAGPCRLGYLAGHLLGERAVRIEILFDAHGSFAGTFGIMAEDRAMVAGALGMLPDDERLFRSFELAAEAGATVDFRFADLVESDHPNAVKFVLTGESGRRVELVGDSTGGGMVRTVSVNGFPLTTTGDVFVLLVFDPLEQLGQERLDRLVRALPEPVDRQQVRVEGRGVLHAFMLAAEPHVAELASSLGAGLPDVSVAVLRPVLPVISLPDRKQQLFRTMTRWREIAEQSGVPLWRSRCATRWTPRGGRARR